MLSQHDGIQNRYQGITHVTRAFDSYLRQIFDLMDRQVDNADTILNNLIQHYLSTANSIGLPSFFTGRRYKYPILMQSLLNLLNTPPDILPATNRTELALTVIASYPREIDPQDDLIGLLSAVISVDPSYLKIFANSRLKPHLILRDLNNVYFHSVIKAAADQKCQTQPSLFMMLDMEIAAACNQVERFLEKIIYQMTGDRGDQSAALLSLEHMTPYLTPEQCENRVLPHLLALLKQGQGGILYNGYKVLPDILEKTSPNTIATVVLPLLVITLDDDNECINAAESLHVVVKKCDRDILMAILKPALIKKIQQSESYESFWFKKYALLLSKGNHEDNKEICDELHSSIPLVPLTLYTVSQIFSKVKQIRHEGAFIPESFNTIIQNMINTRFDTILADPDNLTSNSALLELESHLEHATDNHIRQILAHLTLDTQYYIEGNYKLFEKMADLPDSIFPLQDKQALLARLIEFKSSRQPHVISTLAAYIQWAPNQEILVDLSRHIFEIGNINGAPRDPLHDIRRKIILECTKKFDSITIQNCIIPQLKSRFKLSISSKKYQIDILNAVIDKLDHSTLKNQIMPWLIKDFILTANEDVGLILKKLLPLTSYFERAIFSRAQVKETSSYNSTNLAFVISVIEKQNAIDLKDIAGCCNHEKYDDTAPTCPVM